jgi:hypothetical protein
MTVNVFALGIAAFFAITTVGCAATTSAPIEVPQTSDSPVPGAPARQPTRGLSLDAAERAYVAMSARCLGGAGDESTVRHCQAAANLAATVLHDEQRAVAMTRLARGEAAGSSDGSGVLPEAAR